MLLWLTAVCLTNAACFVNVEDSYNPEIDVTAGDIDVLLDTYTDTHRDDGSAMELLVEGDDSYDAYAELITEAQHHINIETLNFDDDTARLRDVAAEFIQMLVDRAAAGVQINIMLDPLNQNFLSRPESVDILRAGGVTVRYYAPPPERWGLDQVLYRLHKKLLVADGQRAIIGSANFGFRYLTTGQWRETNVRLTGPVVAAIQEEFVRDWEALGETFTDTDSFFPELEPTGDLAIRMIDQRPAVGDFDINNALVITLRSARESVLIETPYLNPTQWLTDELVAAAHRGVEVTLATNSAESTDFAFLLDFSAVFFDEFLANGIDVFLWQPPERNLHSKVIIVDDTFALVTSFNLNNRSVLWDTENGAIFTDPEVVEHIHDLIAEDFCCDQMLQVDEDWLEQFRATHFDMSGISALLGWLF
jgi:cardiolipin synthase